jgi:hypothetical protein
MLAIKGTFWWGTEQEFSISLGLNNNGGMDANDFF